jgi:CheY-like chemotaxis protein
MSRHPDVNLRVKLEENPLDIMVSKVHIFNTIMSLVTNAAEAMPHGGELFIITKNRRVLSPLQGYETVEKGEYAVLEVSDKGVGISHRDLKHIFEPFYTKKSMGRSGTGLGMAIVWNTVHDHNGYVDVKSEEGKGTSFSLYFPVTEEKKIAIPGDFSIEEYAGHGQIVLVVDDVATQREIACSMLAKLGYSADSVSSGEEAVEYIRLHPVDLILLDMIMDPGMDGLATYKVILEIRPDQKVIIISGYAETERVKKIQQLGVKGVIKKPYSFEQIATVVKDVLDAGT